MPNATGGRPQQADMTGGSDRNTERGPYPVASASPQTALLPLLNSGRFCAKCGESLEGRVPDAVYCSVLCRERASRDRRDVREAGIRQRLQERHCKMCLVEIAKGRSYCGSCRASRVEAQRRASEERTRLTRPVKPPRMKRVISRPASEAWLVASGTSGAICELLVAADLLKRGYHVFRAVSPSCPCDLLAMRDNLSARVEVRKVKRDKAGKFPTGIDRSEERARFDVLARVEADGTIHYNGLEKLQG